MKTKVSIVVPVYNSHATLPKCLDSLITQTWQDLEIICVNDKSKDNSVEIIQKYQQKDSRVKLVDHAENMNAGGARNTGIKNATGIYICFVDNDDWLVPDAIETLVEASDEGRIDFVASQWCKYYDEGHKTDMDNLIVGGTKEENCEYALLNGCRILGCLIKKDLFFKNDLLYPEKTFFEDNAIGSCLLFGANEIKVVDRVLYYYQMVEGSSSRSITLVKIIDRIKTSDLFLSNMERLGYVNDKNRVLVNYRYLCFSFFTIKYLAREGSKEARECLDVVVAKIKPMMPNKYLFKYNKGYVWTMTCPHFFYHLWKGVNLLKNLLPGTVFKHQ